MEVKQEIRLTLSEEEKQEFERLDAMLMHLMVNCAEAKCDSIEGCKGCPYDKFVKQANEIRQTIYKWRG